MRDRTVRRKTVPSWSAYVLTLSALLGGYIWGTFYPLAPFSIFAPAVVGLAGAYFAKRVVDKKYTMNGGSIPANPSQPIGD